MRRSSIITRHFVDVGDRQIHYREAGQGPPVVLLHQSPTSSRECEPLMRCLAGHHRVLAPDMPGYGASDPFRERHLTMELLADNLASFLDEVGVAVAGIYGFHTGASVATCFARRHATRVSVSVAVGLLCLTPQERTLLLENYAPPFLPAWDGSHLAWLWSRLKDQSVFFPWYARTAAGRLSMDAAPPAAVQSNLLDWLRSGDGYRDAYQAAFRYRPENDLPAIRTPHFVVDHATDPLFEHLERLPAPHDGFCIVRSATAADAQRLAVDLLRRHPGVAAAPCNSASHAPRRRVRQDYVNVAGTQLRVLRGGDAGTPPVVLLHGAQSSAAACDRLIDTLSEHRSVLAVELPGHGESDALHDPAAYAIPALASLMRHALRELGVSEVDLIGIEAGAAIQTALAVQGGLRVIGLSLVNALDTSQDLLLRETLLESYALPAAADFYGGHLLRAWHAARDHLLFFPWVERRRTCGAGGDPCLDAQIIHRSTVDSLLSGAAGCAIRQAEIRYPLLSHLATVACLPILAAPRWHPRFDHVQEAAVRGACGFRELPADVGKWSALLMR